MKNNCLLLCFFGISIFFIAHTVAREAIVNGKRAGVDQLPYQVSVTVGGQNFCGGGIIDDQHILTAAHCVMQDGKFRGIQMPIFAGTNDLRRTTSPTVIVEMSKIYVPKDYKVDTPEKIADIAVIKLKHRLKLSKHIQKLQLPKPTDNYENKTAVVAGFGWHWSLRDGSNRNGGHNDTQLRFAEVDILDYFPIDEEKIDIPDYMIHGKIKQLDPRKPRGVCLGDSGSPLVHGKTIVAVLNRSSLNCAETQTGGIYAKVSHHLDFIHKALHGNDEDMQVYQFPH